MKVPLTFGSQNVACFRKGGSFYAGHAALPGGLCRTEVVK